MERKYIPHETSSLMNVSGFSTKCVTRFVSLCTAMQPYFCSWDLSMGIERIVATAADFDAWNAIISSSGNEQQISAFITLKLYKDRSKIRTRSCRENRVESRPESERDTPQSRDSGTRASTLPGSVYASQTPG
jgi:hypothetical protein